MLLLWISPSKAEVCRSREGEEMIKKIITHFSWNWPIYLFVGLIIAMLSSLISISTREDEKHSEYIKDLKSKTSEFDLLIDVFYIDERYSHEEIRNLKAYVLTKKK